MDTVVLSVVLLGLVALWAIGIMAVVSAARTPRRAWDAVGRSKSLNVILIFLTGAVGGLYYWTRIRPQLRSSSASSIPSKTPRSDPWSNDGWSHEG